MNCSNSQVHRRLLQDDNFGVVEPLNEPGADGKGLIARGRHWLTLASVQTASAINRPLANEIFLPPVLLFNADVTTTPPRSWVSLVIFLYGHLRWQQRLSFSSGTQNFSTTKRQCFDCWAMAQRNSISASWAHLSDWRRSDTLCSNHCGFISRETHPESESELIFFFFLEFLHLVIVHSGIHSGKRDGVNSVSESTCWRHGRNAMESWD